LFQDTVASLELIPGTGGAYEVSLDDRLIFSKKQTGRYPETAELGDKIKAKV